ncbi:MAG TPA: PAS domain-containing protein, partial [Candidatus Saccharibacteria bacterium]|nr:PAS domain-containing protein [Candidatus Saccharibacteria bacterium]
MFVLSLGLVTLYVIPLMSDIPAEGIFGVTMLHAIAAGISIVVAGVLYFVGPKEPAFWPSFVVYAIFALMVGFLTYQTGGVFSPFVAMWMLVSLFASVFGVIGWLLLLIANAAYTATVYLLYELTATSVAMVIFISIIPLVAGIFAWRGKQESTTQGVEAKRLVNQISEVTSKAEVIINAIGDGVIAVDSQGVIQLINPAAQQILGWGRQDALQLNYKSVLKLIDEENNEITDGQSPVAQALNTNQQIRSSSLTLVTNSNNKLQVSLVASPIGDAGAGIIIVFR